MRARGPACQPSPPQSSHTLLPAPAEPQVPNSPTNPAADRLESHRTRFRQGLRDEAAPAPPELPAGQVEEQQPQVGTAALGTRTRWLRQKKRSWSARSRTRPARGVMRSLRGRRSRRSLRVTGRAPAGLGPCRTTPSPFHAPPPPRSPPCPPPAGLPSQTGGSEPSGPGSLPPGPGSRDRDGAGRAPGPFPGGASAPSLPHHGSAQPRGHGRGPPAAARCSRDPHGGLGTPPGGPVPAPAGTCRAMAWAAPGGKPRRSPGRSRRR